MKKDLTSLTMEGFRAMLIIDKTRLDEAIELQAAIYGEVADRVSISQSVRDGLKNELELLIAKISTDIRTNHRRNKADKDRLTEGAIKESTLLDKRYKEKVEELAEVELEHMRWDALRWAFNQRGQMIRDLAHLFSSEYFTQVSIKGSEGDLQDRDARTAREKMRQRRQER